MVLTFPLPSSLLLSPLKTLCPLTAQLPCHLQILLPTWPRPSSGAGHATGSCHLQTGAAAISALPMEERAVKGPESQELRGPPAPRCRTGSLRKELPWANCSASGSLALQRRNQVIFVKPREKNFLIFYLYHSDLKAASSPFFRKTNKTKLSPIKTNAFNKKQTDSEKKKNLSGSTVCREFSMDVI